MIDRLIIAVLWGIVGLISYAIAHYIKRGVIHTLAGFEDWTVRLNEVDNGNK